MALHKGVGQHNEDMTRNKYCDPDPNPLWFFCFPPFPTNHWAQSETGDKKHVDVVHTYSPWAYINWLHHTTEYALILILSIKKSHTQPSIPFLFSSWQKCN